MDIKYIALALVLLSGPTWADVSLTSSAGVGTIEKRGDGNWRQENNPSFQTMDRRSQVWSIGLTGNTPLSWLDWSIAYVDRGETTAFGSFTQTDEQYFSGDFSNQAISEVRSNVRGITLTVDPKYCSGNWCAFSKIGLFYFEDRFDLYNNGISVRDGVPEDNPLVFLGRNYSTDIAGYWAAGLSYRNVFIQADKDAGGHNSSSTGLANKSMTVGFNYPL